MEHSFDLSKPHLVPLSSCLLQLDAYELAKSQPEGFVHHIVTDPGIVTNSDVDKFISFFPLAWRAIAPLGYFCFWFPIELTAKMSSAARASGFEIQPWPLIGYQIDYPRKGGIKKEIYYPPSYQSCLICWKPGAILAQRQGQSVYSYHARMTMKNLSSPYPQTPHLWRWIYSAIAKSPQSIWDPFAGYGASIIGALVNKLSPIATENDPEVYLKLVENIKNHFHKTLGPNVLFT